MLSHGEFREAEVSPMFALGACSDSFRRQTARKKRSRVSELHSNMTTRHE
jgi:hypothetical protein